ncbi:MAG: HPF/RaiA family ribosome-associated protein [Bacteroidota bacterium]
MENITLETVHFKASNDLESFVKSKISKLFQQNSAIIRADVTLFEGASGNHQNQYCEIQLSVPGENLFVKKRNDNFEKSIVEAVVALKKMMRRKKIKKIR